MAVIPVAPTVESEAAGRELVLVPRRAIEDLQLVVTDLVTRVEALEAEAAGGEVVDLDPSQAFHRESQERAAARRALAGGRT